MNILAGKKTYIVAIGAILYAVGAVVTGNMELTEAVNYILAGAGAAAIRNAIK